jgi:hypothetical protein
VQEIPTNTAIKLHKSTILKPSKNIKYLGVTVDQQLLSTRHLKVLKDKVAKAIAGLSSISGITWGIPVTFTCSI